MNTKRNSSGLEYILILLLSAAGYYLLGIFVPRYDTQYLFAGFTVLFCLYIVLIRLSASLNAWYIIGGGVLLRLVLIGVVPNLSDDVYRFIWDGKLMIQGIDPFAHIPSFYVGSMPQGLTLSLFNKLNSPEYFTVYPPFSQLIFWLSVYLGGADDLIIILWMRVFIILAELGSLMIMLKLLRFYKINTSNIALYAFNPLVILELTGNLHYEAFTICFLLLAVWFFVNHKLVESALFLALAVSVKLLPLLFFPLFYKHLPLKKVIHYYGWTILFLLICFLPLFNTALFSGIGTSVALYFQKFEFNASVYYLLRQLGYWLVGYNTIGVLGSALAVIVLVAVLLYVVKSSIKIGLIHEMLFLLTFYLLMATTVHPWYITSLVAFSVFSKHKYALVWSGCVFLSYAGYGADGFEENFWLTTIEYAILLGAMFLDLRKRSELSAEV